VLVGHVTKENEIAGPRVLEHAVDTVLSFGGDRHHALRLLRALKHRFGSTDELGLFEMGEQGLIGVPDPSALFLADRRSGVAGSIVVPTVDGNRPRLSRQALVVSAAWGSRRSAQGGTPGRLRSWLPCSSSEFVSLRARRLRVGGRWRAGDRAGFRSRHRACTRLCRRGTALADLVAR
jgi:predicted ATP-dependent serine protease